MEKYCYFFGGGKADGERLEIGAPLAEAEAGAEASAAG